VVLVRKGGGWLYAPTTLIKELTAYSEDFKNLFETPFSIFIRNGSYTYQQKPN
jgi:hypothetical protein